MASVVPAEHVDVRSAPPGRGGAEGALVEGAAEPGVVASSPETPPPGPARRAYRLGLAGLLGAQLLLTVWLAAHSFFYADDFLYGSILTTEPLSRGLLFRSWFGHLGPGYIVVDWTFFRVVGLSWPVAVAGIVAIQSAATVALVRLLDAVRGRAWSNLAAAAVTLSLVIATQSLWWAAALSNILPLSAAIATLGCFARWARTGRIRHLIGMAVMFGVAVSFYEKAVLTVAYAVLLSVLLLDAGLPWRERLRSTLRRWPAWLVLAVIAGTDLAVFLSGDYMQESGPPPPLKDLAAFLVLSLPEGLVPTLFGFEPATLSHGARVAVLLVTNAAVLALVVWTSVRSRIAFQAWVFFGLAYLLNEGMIGRGRVGMLGVHMGTVLRYHVDTVALLGVTLGVVLPVAIAGVRRPPGGGRAAPRRLVGALVVVAALVAVAVPWSQSLRHERDLAGGAAARAYLQALHASFLEARRADPAAGVLAGDVVPGWMVYATFAPYNRFDRVLPLVLPDVPFTRNADHVLTVDAGGVARRSRFVEAVDVPTEGQCLAAVPGQPAFVARLAQPLAEGQWEMRLRFHSDAPGTVTLTVDNDALGADMRMASEGHAVTPTSTELTAVAGTVAVHKLSVQYDGPGRFCLDSLQLGTFQPG